MLKVDWKKGTKESKKGISKNRRTGNQWSYIRMAVQSRANKIPISRPLIQEKTYEIVNKPDFTDFKASYGWIGNASEAGSMNMGQAQDLNVVLLNTVRKLFTT